jgi:hypothetical protein
MALEHFALDFRTWPDPVIRCGAAIGPESGANRTHSGRGREVGS